MASQFLAGGTVTYLWEWRNLTVRMTAGGAPSQTCLAIWGECYSPPRLVYTGASWQPTSPGPGCVLSSATSGNRNSMAVQCSTGEPGHVSSFLPCPLKQIVSKSFVTSVNGPAQLEKKLCFGRSTLMQGRGRLGGSGGRWGRKTRLIPFPHPTPPSPRPVSVICLLNCFCGCSAPPNMSLDFCYCNTRATCCSLHFCKL